MTYLQNKGLSMINVQTAPIIQNSAQTRLLLYRLLSSKLNIILEKLLSTDPCLWEAWIEILNANVMVAKHKEADKRILIQAFSQIEKNIKNRLQHQIDHLIDQALPHTKFPQYSLNPFIDDYQKMIKSIQHEYLDKLHTTISHGFCEGRLQKDIAKDIRHVTDLSKHRAQSIARNTIAYYTEFLTKHYQISTGINAYV